MPLSASVVVDREALRRYMTNVNKPPMRRAMVVADRVARDAREQIHSDFPRRFLAIVKRPGIDGRGGYVDVGSPRWRTRPHRIEGNPLLAFRWKRVGRFVVVRSVNHPGSDFTAFLRRVLLAALARQKGRV